MTTEKTLTNTTASQAKGNVQDIQFWGNGDMFKLLSKASSLSEKWMKSTKAMEIPDVGCVVQVTTQQGGQVAEALTYVPYVKIRETKNEEGQVIARHLVSIDEAGRELDLHSLTEALKNDPDYRRSWSANIAMAFKDRYHQHGKKHKNHQDIHEIANAAAEYFLNLLCD